MSNALISFDDQERMAHAIVKSGFFGLKEVNQVLALMSIAQAEGKHPATVAQEYDIIQGRPALKSQALLARFQLSGGRVEYLSYTDEKVEMLFSHPAGGDLKVEWTMKQARDIGLASKDNWKKYPRQMLAARVVSEGIRRVYPACILGHYAVEEVMDFDDKKQLRKPEPIIDIDHQQVPEGTIPLYVPDMNGGEPNVYKMAVDTEEWMIAFEALKSTVNNSKKLSDEEKRVKILALKAVNMIILNQMEGESNEANGQD